MALMGKRKKNREIALPEVTLTPLIDTALTLLVIFMVTTPMIQNSLKISLPEAKSKSESAIFKQDKPIEILIDKDKKLSLNNKTNLDYDILINHVKQELKISSNKIIIIKADSTVDYATVVKILDAINAIEGEKYVALATKKSN